MEWEIFLSNSDEVAVVSTREDYELVRRHSWHLNQDGYARTQIGGKKYMMHRLLAAIELPPRACIDHIDGNRLNNRRENLRVCTISENNRNRKAQRGGSSRFKGVSWAKPKGKWLAGIMVNGRHIHLGYFDNEEEAARAYDAKARELHHEFAYLNFP